MSQAIREYSPGEREAELQARLGDWLRSKCNSPAAEIITIETLSGGYTNLTWSVSAKVPGFANSSHLDFVLRLSGESDISSPDDLTLRTQFELLNALESTPVRAPTPLWFESDSSLLGGEFLAMQQMGGETGPRFFPLDDPLRNSRLHSFVQTLSNIHAIDWRARGLERILPAPVPQSCAQTAMDRVMRCVGIRGAAEHPLARRAVSWLAERIPSRCEIALVHGDSNLSNYRFENGSVVGVLDWEMAMLTDPAWDIAFYCGAIPKFYAEQPKSVQNEERELFLDLYTSETGRSMADLPFWEALFTLRAASGSQLAAMGDNRSTIYWERLDALTQ